MSVPNVDLDGKETEGTHWRYDERQLTREEFGAVAYEKLFDVLKNMDEAIAEVLLNQMEV